MAKEKEEWKKKRVSHLLCRETKPRVFLQEEQSCRNNVTSKQAEHGIFIDAIEDCWSDLLTRFTSDVQNEQIDFKMANLVGFMAAIRMYLYDTQISPFR